MEAKTQAIQFVEHVIEHCESVHVFLTINENGASSSYEVGRGNFYATLGQTREWLTIQEQFQRNFAIRKDSEQ